MNKERETTKLWDDYQNGLNFQSSTGLSKNLPTFVKFYEGKQWAEVTENTASLPRPVVNIIKMICRNKKAAILSTPVKIIYQSEHFSADVDRFNHFADYIQKEYGQEALDKKAIDDGVKKGSYFYHYYWDAEAIGKNGIKEGGLRCEIIDPLNIFFSNPTELDEQKQEWILIASRENVKSVRLKADKGVDKEAIVPDTNDSKYGTIEQEGDKLCTVLTRYFRKNGEVFCEKATKTVIVNKPFSITPNLAEAGKELGYDEADAPNTSLPDDADADAPTPNFANLYPIVVGNYDIKEGSIYGLGEVEGLIPNQKSINFNLAMALLNVQENAWGKYIALPNALKGQQITNTPGQVLIDHSGTGTGIRKMAEQGLNNQPIQLIDTLTQLTRVVTGATEVMTGETLGAGMSGAAIAQLQAQAMAPIDELRDAFWIVKEKQGKVLAQFFKLFYYNKEFTYTEDISKQDILRQAEEGLLNDSQISDMLIKEQAKKTDIFNSSDYANTNFSIVVETTTGTKSSAAGDINMLELLLSKGLISLKTFIKAYPNEALSNRSEILKGIEADEQSEINVLKQQLEQANQQNIELAKVVEEQRKTVDKVVPIIKELNQLKVFVADMYTEASGKISMANKIINETLTDAGGMAHTIATMQAQKQGSNVGTMPI
jgi:hypothetical protein